MIVPGAAPVVPIGEGVARIVLRYLKGLFAIEPGPDARVGSDVKGVLERGVMVPGMLAGFPQVLIAFSALKIATRLRDKEDQITNDYFLVGNLASMLIAIVDAAVAAAILGAG